VQKNVQEAPELSNTSRILDWSSNIMTSTRKRKFLHRYGFPRSSPTPIASKTNPKRRRTEGRMEIREHDLDQVQSIRSKSPSNRVSVITDVDQLEKYDPPIYFKPTWEFEGADGDRPKVHEYLKSTDRTHKMGSKMNAYP
jgi:hypothetical protein